MDEQAYASESEAPSGADVTPITSEASSAIDSVEVVRGGGRRWLAITLAAVVIVAVAVVLWLLQTTVPTGDLDAAEAELGAARAELADTRADLQAARQQAEADLAAAAGRESDLNGVITGLEGDVEALRADLVARESELSASQANAEALAESVAAEQARAAAAEEQVAAAVDAVEDSFTTWKFYLAWTLWASSDFAREVERQDADASSYDELVQALGLADSWDEWARAEGNEPLRELDTLMEGIGNDELEDLFDAFFDCDSRRRCLRTAVVLDGSVLGAITEEMQAIGEALGNALLFGAAL